MSYVTIILRLDDALQTQQYTSDSLVRMNQMYFIINIIKHIKMDKI